MKDQLPKPRHEHDCSQCTFLGYYNEYDLYFCPQHGVPTVIARFSSHGPDYTSGLHSQLPQLIEAENRAIIEGLFL